MANPVPLTGRQYELAAGDYRATVTALGAGLRRLSYRGQDLITSYDADEVPPAGAGELLAPWPNRVDRGRYSFGGADYQLDLSEPANGNAIHGLTRWAGWQAEVSDGGQVLLRHQLLVAAGLPPADAAAQASALRAFEAVIDEVADRLSGKETARNIDPSIAKVRHFH